MTGSQMQLGGSKLANPAHMGWLTTVELKNSQFNPTHFLMSQKFCNLVRPTTS